MSSGKEDFNIITALLTEPFYPVCRQYSSRGLSMGSPVTMSLGGVNYTPYIHPLCLHPCQHHNISSGCSYLCGLRHVTESGQLLADGSVLPLGDIHTVTTVTCTINKLYSMYFALEKDTTNQHQTEYIWAMARQGYQHRNGFDLLLLYHLQKE